MAPNDTKDESIYELICTWTKSNGRYLVYYSLKYIKNIIYNLIWYSSEVFSYETARMT